MFTLTHSIRSRTIIFDNVCWFVCIHYLLVVSLAIGIAVAISILFLRSEIFTRLHLTPRLKLNRSTYITFRNSFKLPGNYNSIQKLFPNRILKTWLQNLSFQIIIWLTNASSTIFILLIHLFYENCAEVECICISLDRILCSSEKFAFKS